MTPDQELVLLFGALHLVALGLACALFWMFLKSDTVAPWEPPDEEEGGGGGGNDRVQDPPKPPRPGGIKLPAAAEQSAQRFRGEGRLADRYDRARRGRPHTPRRAPERTPQRAR